MTRPGERVVNAERGGLLKFNFLQNLAKPFNWHKRSKPKRLDWFVESLRHLPNSFFLINIDAGKVIFANKAGENLMGISMKGTTGKDYYGKVVTAYFMDGTEVPLEKTFTQRIIAGDHLDGDELIIDGPNGRYYIKAHSRVIPTTIGEPRCTILVIQDQTKLKEAEAFAKTTREELQTSIEALGEVIENIGLPVALLHGPKHRFSVVSQEFIEKFSPVPNPIGMKIFDLFPEGEHEYFRGILDEVYQTGKPKVLSEVPFSQTLKDGTQKDYILDITYAPKRNEQGKVDGVLAVVIDSTEYVDNRSKVKEDKRRLDQFFDALPQMIFMARADGSIYRFNKRWYEYIGATGETEGWGWKDQPIHHPDDLERTVKRWKESVDTGKEYEIEYRLRRGDGQYRWHLGRATAIRNSVGEIVEWFGTNTDIHDLRTLQENMKESERRLDITLAAANVGFWTYNTATKKTFISPSLMRSWGIDPDTFDDSLEACFQRIHPEDIDGVKKSIHSSIQDRKFYDIEYRVVRPDGEIRFINARGETSFDDNGEPCQFSGVTIDITDKVKNEERLQTAIRSAESASRAKSEFLANMSHEIRTPLGAILGFSEVAKQAINDTRDLETYLSIINRSSKQVLRIIDDILDLSKVEAGKIVLERHKFSLSNFLLDFKSIYEFRAAEKGIEFKLNFTTKIPNVIVGDATRIRQILNNVVGNAIKFTQVGLVELNLSFDKTLGTLCFEVIDSGPGISEEQQKKLFQPFVQADASTTRQYGGTGLGLILTRRLCEHMDGDFYLAESTLGQGSKFIAKISIGLGHDIQLVDWESDIKRKDFSTPMGSLEKRLSNVRTLLVEDSPENQLLFSVFLSKHGTDLQIANDGAEGLEMALNNDYDVILMDIQMPKLDGHQVVQQLREKGVNTPIIALTAHAMKEEVERALQSGFTEYLSKPVNENTLVNTIARNLN